MEQVLLFFDDQAFAARKNLTRCLGHPVFNEGAEYRDPSGYSMCGGLPNVFFDEDAGEYRMLYTVLEPSDRIFLLAAHSKDALHWEPLDTTTLATYPNRQFFNEAFPEQSGEVGCVYQDKRAPLQERYKLFYCRYACEVLRVRDELWTSPDGLNWTLKPGVTWNPDGSEPGMGCFWSAARESYVITCRPHWAERRVCVTETKDWKTFSPIELAVQVDSLDLPMAETYGMPVYPYGNNYIGLLWIYQNQPDAETEACGGLAINQKGRMAPQLVYSLNGWHFQRSLREHFIENGTPFQPHYGCLFVNSMMDLGDRLRFFAAGSNGEHGGFRDKGLGTIVSFDLRKDGFVFLESNGDALLRTKQLLVQGDIRLSADVPGVAKYRLLDHEQRPVPGFDFEDCVPFSGSATDFVLSWKGGSAKDLQPRSLCLEIALYSGRLYALKGNFIPMGFNQDRLFRTFGTVPDRKGF